jgi:outer membrane protein OmpA-like peptidoglycan-associated protein
MKTAFLTMGALALSLLGTGCIATHKYVAKTIAPIEQRVGTDEAKNDSKNTDQDKQLATHTGEIADLDKDLSQTKEKLRDTDNKASQAGEAAKMADQHAGAAQQSADGAKQAADGARTFAEQGLTTLDKNMQAANKFQVLKSDNILFDFNKDTLTAEGKAQLDDLAHQAMGLERYVIELQGFTDKSGSSSYNENLSAARVQVVARYLANHYDIPVRNISMLGSGYAKPVADDKTREGRKMNRRVEVRLWVPESQSGKTVASNTESK